ncbi:polyadenylate-binding protein 7-like isoform X1 [Tripterygium wilfordii]|uniref:Polyadenylate-binding protein n=1 Tax=Tripterygium wilfordii TaxID=458696 RepID=A0A7J7DNA7_TRIWF|nr:polyadenylate-binding protein 7-like isoform X1 [Tripterygium wilfordii]
MELPSAVVTQSTTSLYVGDLHPDVTDGQLADIFAEFKSIGSVRLCRDSTTGRSLCYGYVNFVSPQDAAYAIETKNHMVLNGKAIRVMWSQRDPDTRKMGVGNVYVKNLVNSIDNVGLQDLFQKFGNILSCKVAISEEGKSKGYGYVQFETEESAKTAIEKLNGSTVGGKQIFVGKFIRKSDRILTGPDSKYSNLYVKNLDSDLTEEHLENKFSKFGKIVSLVIAKDDNGASKGFGFVNCENPDDARRALEAMNGLELGTLCVSPLPQLIIQINHPILNSSGSNVYVKNVDDDVAEEELREHFSQCGGITSARLMRDDKGISRGFGFVCFSSPEEAAKAVNTLHGYMFHRKPLYVAIAQRKEDRQAQLQLRFAQRMAGLAGPSANVIPGTYPSLYYTAPGVVSQVPPRPWVDVPAFGHQRQNRGRVNGQSHLQVGAHSVAYMPHLRQPTQSVTSSKDLNNQQVKYVPNGRAREVNTVSGVLPAAPHSVETASKELDTLSSMLASASRNQQKQILGERLYPLVQKQKSDLVAKITGMILEMDNSELFLLLESRESLAAKVEEAVQVLKLSKTKASGQDSLHPTYLSAEVAVN